MFTLQVQKRSAFGKYWNFKPAFKTARKYGNIESIVLQHYAEGNGRVAPGRVLIIDVNVIVLFIDFVQRRVLLKTWKVSKLWLPLVIHRSAYTQLSPALFLFKNFNMTLKLAKKENSYWKEKILTLFV